MNGAPAGPQNIDGPPPDPDHPDWEPDLPEGASDEAYYGEEAPHEDA